MWIQAYLQMWVRFDGTIPRFTVLQVIKNRDLICAKTNMSKAQYVSMSLGSSGQDHHIEILLSPGHRNGPVMHIIHFQCNASHQAPLKTVKCVSLGLVPKRSIIGSHFRGHYCTAFSEF